MLITSQNQICLSQRMEICKSNVLPVKRNVARKSTSNRPLKNTIHSTCELGEKVNSILNDQSQNLNKNCFSKGVISCNKYSVLKAGEVQPKVSSVCVAESYPIRTVNCNPTLTLLDEEKPYFYDDSDEDNEDTNGVFSISEFLLPFYDSSKWSPTHSEDSTEGSFDSSRILNYPTKTNFTPTTFKDVPFYSNKLFNSISFLETSDSDKNEKVNCDASTNVLFAEESGSKCLVKDIPSVGSNLHNESLNEVKELTNSSSTYQTGVDNVEQVDNVEGDSWIRIENIFSLPSDDAFVEVDSIQLPVETPVLSDGTSELSNEPSKLSDKTPIVPKKSKNKKRKPSTKLYFGSRKKKPKCSPKKSSLSKVVDSNKIQTSPESTSTLNGNNLNFTEQHTISKATSDLNAAEEFFKFETTTNVDSDEKNLSISSENLNNETISTVAKSIDSIENNNHTSEENCTSIDSKSKEIESKKRIVTGEKKTKKEINEGVLLHVEAAKETDIMRDGKILKDKQDLLKDIESKIEKNIPVEVKDFDIQQSLTEEILLEQALRLAHQRTSPRRRPLLSKSETKAILKCLSNQSKYNTRKSVNKKGVNYKDSLNIEESLRTEVDASDSHISDSSSVDNPDTNDSTVESRVKSPTENTENSDYMCPSKQQKKHMTKKLNKSSKKSKSQNSTSFSKEKFDLNTLSKTFEDVLQDIQSANSSDDTAYSGNEGKKKGTKGTYRKKKHFKKKNVLNAEEGHFISKEDSDKSATENDECQDRRIPVIIIKNKKVTLADRRKNRRVTNSLFSIIKPRDSPSIMNSQMQSEKSDDLQKGDKNYQDPNSSFVVDISITEKTEKYNNYEEALSDSLDNCASKFKINEIDQGNDSNKLSKSAIDSSPSNQNTKLSPPNRTFESSDLCSGSARISKLLQPSNSDDIVEVIDMDVDADSPKTNSSPVKFVEKNIVPTKDSNSSSSIPFLDGTDSSNISNKEMYSDESVMAIINKSDEKALTSICSKEIVGGDTIGFPIPTITEMKSRYLPAIVTEVSQPEFSPPTPLMCSAGSMASSMSLSMSTELSPLPTSLSNASGFTHPPPSVNSHLGFTTTATDGSISSVSSPFYPSYSPAVSSLPMNVKTLPHFNSCNSRPLQQRPMCSSALTTITPSQMYQGQMTPVPCPIVQSPASESSPSHNINTNLHYPGYLHTGTGNNQCPFPYPPSLETSKPIAHSNISSQVMKEVNDNTVNIQPQISMLTCETIPLPPEQPAPPKQPPPPEQPPPPPPPLPEPEKPKAVDIPLCIVARDPRLRSRSVRVIIDSHNIDITPSFEKCAKSSNLLTHNAPEKTKEKCSGLIKPFTEVEVEQNEERENSQDAYNETECDNVNDSPKKKSKKKEVDQELLYKTPLSDLHDAPERTSSYSRTTSRKPRFESRRDPRSSTKRDINDDVSSDNYHHEPYRDHNQDKYPENYVYDGRIPHETYPPDIRGPDYQSYDHFSNWKQDEFSQDKQHRDYLERRPLLEHTSDFRRPYRQHENYADSHSRSHEFRRHNGTDYARKSADDLRWDYAHKRLEETEASESLRKTEDFSKNSERWEDENEIRDLIDGPVPSSSRPFYRRKRFSKPWRQNHLRDDDDGSCSPYNEDLFERRRDFESRRFGEDVNDRVRERPWFRKSNNEHCGPDRGGWEDRRYHRSIRGSREGHPWPSRRNYEMYEKKRCRSPRRKEINRGPGRGSVSPKESTLDLETPMSPEPVNYTYAESTPYSSISQ